MSFSLTVSAPFPRAQADGFPKGIQWQADGTDLGDRHVQTVNLVGFGSGGATRDADTLTVVAAAGAGGGSSPSDLEGASATLTGDQTSGQTIVFDSVSAPRWSTGGMSLVNGRYTVRSGQAGVYRASASVQVNNSLGEGSPAFVALEIIRNQATSPVALGHDEANVGDSAQLQPSTGDIVLAVGDTLEVRRNSSPFSATVSAIGATYTHFTVVRVGDTPSGG